VPPAKYVPVSTFRVKAVIYLALDALATDRQNYALVLDAALRITSARSSLSAKEATPLKRLRTVGKEHGWI
jgi:hypothetical protein